ncbi:MAG: diacylglycerol kinase family protein [Myxococcota bacterium]
MSAFGAHGIEVADVVSVLDLPDEPQGAAWAERGIAAVVGAGGDGTLGTVATHLAGIELPLGILPLGTANDTARSLGIPLELEAAVAAFATGQILRMDVGEVVAPDGRSARFLHAATLGLNAEFARLATDVERRARLGPLNYPASALAALANTRSRSCTVRLDDGTVIEGPALQIAALNLPHMLGGTIDIDLPDIHPQDGLLTVLVVRNLLAIDRYATRRLWVDTTVGDGEAPDEVTLDGELLFTTPVEIRIADAAIPVVVPAAVG